MRLSSRAFEHNGAIPAHYTCQGKNVNPPLQIEGVPEGTASLALICDDPDAATDPDGPGHTFDHWVMWNMPPQLRAIPENTVPPSTMVGVNGADALEYSGPCPPNGTHRYFFRLYALDTKLDIPEGSDAETVEDSIGGHVLARTELIGTYQKS